MRAMIKSEDGDADDQPDCAAFTGVFNARVDGRRSNATFLASLELWVHQETIVRINGTTASAPIQLIHHGNRRVTIRAANQDAATIQLWLYDQAGHELLTRESTGNRLTVNLGLVQGRALTTGVYLAKVRVQAKGDASRRAIKSVSIVR